MLNPKFAIRNSQFAIISLCPMLYALCLPQSTIFPLPLDFVLMTPSALTPRILGKQVFLIFTWIMVFNKSPVGGDKGLRELTPWTQKK